MSKRSHNLHHKKAVAAQIQRGRFHPGPAPTPVPPVETSPAFATLTLTNTSAVTPTPSESYVTFGMAFKKGDVSSSQIPQVRGAVSQADLPCQFDLRSTWSDSSLRWAEVSMIGPSIAAGSSYDIEIYAKTGSFNNTASRVLSDITGSTDLKVAITNLTDYLGTTKAGGSTTADFNTSSSVGANTEVMKSGPICNQWRTWMYFPGQTSGGEQLAAWFYVTAWTKNSDSTLGPISHITKIHNGWLNKTSPTKYLYSAEYKNGASVIRNFSSTASADKTFTASAATDVITCTSHGRATGDPVQVSNSGGALPTGLSASTIYYCIVTGTDTLKLATSGVNAQGASAINLTTDGTGTNTLIFRIAQPHHTHWWSCDTDGLSDWTSSEATIQVMQDRTYLHSTALLPPYDLSLVVSPSSLTSKSYTPFCAADLKYDIDGAGGDVIRGYLTSGAAKAFLTQEVGYLTNARVNALAVGNMPVYFPNEATGKVPTIRGSSLRGDTGNYTGLGTNGLDLFYHNASVVTGITVSVGGDGGYTASTGWDWSHYPESIHYTLVTEGGAHLLDAEILYANQGMLENYAGDQFTGYSANGRKQRVTSSDPFHYALWIRSGNGMRSNAWRTRTICNTAALIPDAWVEKVYFNDLLAGNAAYAAAYIAGQTTPFTTVGHWYQGTAASEWQSPWMHNFGAAAWAHVYKIHELADALTFVNHLKKLPIGFADGTWGCCLTASGAYRYTMHNNAGLGTSFCDWSEIGVAMINGSMSAATDTFTTTASSDHNKNQTAQNDQKVKWPTTNTSLGAQTKPSELSSNVFYYMVNASGGDLQLAGTTFKVAATLGGSAIDIVTAGGNCDLAWLASTNCATTSPNTSPDTYHNIALATLYYMKACGISGTDTAISTLAPFHVSNDATDPSWAMQGSF